MKETLSESVAQAIGHILKDMRGEVNAQIKSVRDEVSDLVLSGLIDVEDKTQKGAEDAHAKLAQAKADFDAILEAHKSEVSREIEAGLQNTFEAVAALIDERVERAQVDSDLMLAQAQAKLAKIDADFRRDSDSIASLQQIDGKRTFLVGAYGLAGSSLYRARIETTKTPTEDPGAWQAIAAGIDSWEWQTEDGEIFGCPTIAGEKAAPQSFGRLFEFVGPHKDGEEYKKNQIVMKDWAGWLCRANKTTTTPGAPDNFGEWSLVFRRGEQGEKGERGPRGQRGATGKAGEAGVGVREIASHGLKFVFVLSDGEIKTIELDGLQAHIQETVDAAVKKALSPATLKRV